MPQFVKKIHPDGTNLPILQGKRKGASLATEEGSLFVHVTKDVIPAEAPLHFLRGKSRNSFSACIP